MRSMRGPRIALLAAVGGALLVPAAPLAEDPPKPPTAVLESASDQVQAGDSIELDSSRSTAGDAPITGHVWDLDGNGTFETDTKADPKVTAKPDTAGPLTVHVRVVDEAGQQADASRDLVVTAPPMKAATKSLHGSGTSVGGAGEGDGEKPASPAPEVVDAPTPQASAPAAESPQQTAGAEQSQTSEQPEPLDNQSTLPRPNTARMAAAPVLLPRKALATTKPRAKPAFTIRAAAASGVTIKDFKFAPASITVHEGDTITWTNQDIAPHTATASDGSFDTGNISKGGSGSATFSKAGTIPYICSIHPNMKGTVVVAAASGSDNGGGASGSGDDTSSGDTPDDSGGLPQTGLNLAAVVLLAALMMGSGTLLRRRTG